MRSVYGDPRRLAAPVLRRYIEFFHGEDTRTAIGKMVPTLDFADLDTDVLKTIDVPSLVLWGGGKGPLDSARACGGVRAAHSRCTVRHA